MLINNFVKKYSIYAIKCNKTNNVYVGSTSNLLNRLGNHISSYKKVNQNARPGLFLLQMILPVRLLWII